MTNLREEEFSTNPTWLQHFKEMALASYMDILLTWMKSQKKTPPDNTILRKKILNNYFLNKMSANQFIRNVETQSK